MVFKEEAGDADSSFQQLLAAQKAGGQELSPVTGAWKKEPIPEGETQAEGDDALPLELKMTQEMQAWIRTFSQQPEGNRQVSMFNLLAFKGSSHGQAYTKYIDAFVKGVGTRWGGSGKIAGDVVSCSSTAEGVHEWDTMVIAQYPSIQHFAEMVVSEDYHEIDRKHRAGNLKDTLILCTVEVDLEGS
ncbi:MAG: hypothetical protein MMC33_000533 [Icmadophila ericetorum]|nr:hypothetical protein [Icmadophila ericetorum]